MKLLEIIELVKKGELVLEKHNSGTKTLYRGVYSKTEGEWIDVIRTRKGKDVLEKKWHGKFEKWNSKQYPIIQHMAMYPNTNSGFKISKKVYEQLSK